MAKKSARIDVALRCIVCNTQNYVTEMNKDNKPSALSKFCRVCRTSEEHKLKEKLK